MKHGGWWGAAGVMSLAMLAASCGTSRSSRTAPAADVAAAAPCTDAACFEQRGDYLGARDAVFRGCLDGDAASCLQANFGPYLFSDEDRKLLAVRGCAGGEELICEQGCLVGAGDVPEEELDAANAANPTSAANAPDATTRAIRQRCARRERLLRDGGPWEQLVTASCGKGSSIARCEAALELRGSTTPSLLKEGRHGNVTRARLCQRGSARACAEEISRRCRGLHDLTEAQHLFNLPNRACTAEELAEIEQKEGGRALLEETRRRCASGQEEACVTSPELATKQKIALCQRGYRPACMSLASSEQPLDGAPLCLAGDQEACGYIASSLFLDLGGDHYAYDVALEQTYRLLFQRCGADLSECPLTFAGITSPWRRRAITVDEIATSCGDALTGARAAAKLLPLPPGRELDWALRGCEQHVSAPARTCLARATTPSDLYNCHGAQTASGVLTAEARRLARASIDFFLGKQQLPPAWTKQAQRAPCCGAACEATRRPASDDSEPYALVPQTPEEIERFFERPDVILEDRYAWVQLMLTRQGDTVVASASGQWRCDQPTATVEARWKLVAGKPGELTITRR